MMAALREWLLGVTAAAFAVSLAQALTPEGTVKKVGRLAGSLVLLLAVIRPLTGLGQGEPELPAAVWQTEETRIRTEAVLGEFIAEAAAAYIEEQAIQRGCPCTAAVGVETDGEGWPVPWEAELTGSWTENRREAMAAVLERELNIPRQRQRFREGGA